VTVTINATLLPKIKGTVSVHSQSKFLNLASGRVVNCESLSLSVDTTTTSDRRNDFECLCKK